MGELKAGFINYAFKIYSNAYASRTILRSQASWKRVESGSELGHSIDACSGMTPSHNDFCVLLNLIIALLLVFIVIVFAHHGPHRLSICLHAPRLVLVRLKSKHSYVSYNILQLIPNDSNLNQVIGHQHRTYF